MSFTQKKFQSLSHYNQNKKLAFAIKQYLHGLASVDNAETFYRWSCADSQMPQTRQAWQLLYEQLLQELGENCRFADKELFDSDKIPDGRGVVILDNIRSPYNVGGIMRSAECFSLDKVVLCGITPTTENAKVVRCSMNVPIKTQYFKTTIEAVNHYKRDGSTIIAVEKTKLSVDIEDLELPSDKSKLAVIVGNEEFGIDQDILAQADKIVHIHLTGRKNSLNVCSAAAVALYKIFGQKSLK